VWRNRQRSGSRITSLAPSHACLGASLRTGCHTGRWCRISRSNCARQPFSESEIGLYKATVLATRINLFWGLGWRGNPQFLDEGWREETDILIGCVDSRKARRAITNTSSFWNSYYWLDLGNNADAGQFVLGQPQNRKNQKTESRLPTVAELFPEIIDLKLDKKDKLPSCSAVEALERQEPFLNQVLANHSLAMLARLFRRGRLPYHGGFVNVATGRVSSLAVQGGQQTRDSISAVSLAS
jgi:PRTRC genetic system ThiF family protein